MGYIGQAPTAVPLSGDDITDGIITSAKIANGTIVNADINASAAIVGTKLTALTYLHTVQTHVIVASSQSISAATVTNITSLNATITPTAGTKILVTVRWNGEAANANNEGFVFGIRRDSTIVGSPDAASNRTLGIAIIAQGYFGSNAASTPDSCFYQYLDSPSTGSAITYHATISNLNAQTIYNNRTVDDSDNNGRERLTSTITLQEVVAP